MRVRAAGPGLAALVDESVHVRKARLAGYCRASAPRGGDVREFVRRKAGNAQDMTRDVDDNLLAAPGGKDLERSLWRRLRRRVEKRGKEVREDAHAPPRPVLGALVAGDRERLWRSLDLVSLTERAVARIVGEPSARRRSRSPAAGRSDDDQTAGDRVPADVRDGLVQDSGVAGPGDGSGAAGGATCRGVSRNGFKISIGSGRIIVDVRSEDISRIVCK